MFRLLILLLLTTSAYAADRSERHYQEIANTVFQGELEHRVTHGRVDILTEEYAIEVDFCKSSKRKEYEAVGQAIRYSRLTGRRPAVLLIIENADDYKYVEEVVADTQKCIILYGPRNLPAQITVFTLEAFSEQSDIVIKQRKAQDFEVFGRPPKGLPAASP